MKYLLLLIVLLSCASNEDKEFVEQVSPDLVDTFDIENKKFAKFVIKKEKPTPKKVQPVLEKKKPEKKLKKKEIEEKPQKVLKITAKEDVVEIPEVPEVSETSDEPKGFVAPEDYPKELLDLDKISKKHWENYRPNYRIGEEFLLSINYLGITAGHVRFITRGGLEIGTKEALHFRALFKTSKFYKYIFEADDMVETYVSKDRFLPIKYSLVQRESNKDVDDLQLFDHEERKTYMFYKKVKEGKVTKKEKESYTTEYFQDFMSTLFFVRGLPMRAGDVYKFPVFTRGKFWRLTIKVAKRTEKIKVMDKWHEAIRLDTVALPPASDKKKKKSTISFWYSNDDSRIFLKLQAKLKFGSIEGEIEEHLPGRKP